MSELTKSEELLRLKVQLAQAKSYLDINDVVLYSSYSQSTIRRRVLEGRLKVYQNVKGGKLLFDKKDIDVWLKGEQG